MKTPRKRNGDRLPECQGHRRLIWSAVRAVPRVQQDSRKGRLLIRQRIEISQVHQRFALTQAVRRTCSSLTATVLGTGTQTSYVVALFTKMAPKMIEPVLVDKLVKDIESRNWHLSTGFLGTPFLLFTLADHGRSDVAYRLLLNESYPSWGYMISKGATTWWERWNGDTGDPAINS